MSRTIGRVDFTARIDGTRTPRDAENIGRKAGASASDGYDETWSKGFRETLTKSGQASYDRWRKSGKKDGSVYSQEMDKTMQAFLRKASKDVTSLQFKRGFMDEFSKGFKDAGYAAEDMQQKIIELRRQNKISEAQFQSGKRTVDDWAKSQYEAGVASNDHRDALAKLNDDLYQQRKSYEDGNSALVERAKLLKAEQQAFALDERTKLLQSLKDERKATQAQKEELRESNRLRLENERAIRANAKAMEAERKAMNVAERERNNAALEKNRILLRDSVEVHIRSSEALQRHIEKVGSSKQAYDDFSIALEKYRDNVGHTDQTYISVARSVDKMTTSIDKNNTSIKKTGNSWSKIPHNGRQIILITAAIAGGFEQMSTLGSGASGALGGLIGVLGSGLGGAAALGGTALVGFAWQAGLAVAAAKHMGDEFPAAATAMKRLAKSAENDSRAFARAWGPALAEFSNTLADLWRDDKVGERLGDSMAKITQAFTGVLRSPAYANFQKAMETTIPDSLTALGTGAASLSGGLLNIFAAAGPALRTFSEAFSAFARNWSDKIQRMADSGALAATIDQMRESFQGLLKLAGSLMSALSGTFGAGVEHGQRMVGMLTRLTDQWRTWTQSIEGQQALKTWFDNGERMLGALLILTGQLGTMFANIVTPESMERTFAFLQNLGGALGLVEDIALVLGAFDVFGLAAQLLNELGQAIAPLQEPLTKLAGVISKVLSVAITTLSDVIGFVIPPIAAFVGWLADLADAVPTPVIEALTYATLGFGAAVLAIKFATFLGGLGGIAGLAASAKVGVGNLGKTLGTSLGKAGMIGVAIVGLTALTSAMNEGMRAYRDIDTKAREAVVGNQSFAKSVEELGSVWQSTAGGISNGWDEVLNKLDGFHAVWSSLSTGYDSGMAKVYTDVYKVNQSLQELDPQLAQLANANLPAAQAQFAKWAEEMGASDDQVLTLLSKLPEFKSQIDSVTTADSYLAVGTDLVNLALGRSAGASEEVKATLDRMKSSTDSATDATGKNTQAVILSQAEMDALSAKTNLSASELKKLGSQLDDATKKMFSSRDAARDYHQSIETLTSAIAENGGTLDITTEAGRANESAIDDLADSTLNLARETYANTGSQEEANAVIAAGREKLIEQIAAFGKTGDAANAYVDDLGLVPGNISTGVELTGAALAKRTLDDLAKDRTAHIKTVVNTFQNLWGGGTSTNNRPMASGGVVSGAQRRTIGEAGPEAVVPLDRSLSRVDPSVRWLSAIAQGKSAPAMAGGGVIGGGGNTFEAGSIVVQGATDPRRTAHDVADVIAERINS